MILSICASLTTTVAALSLPPIPPIAPLWPAAGALRTSPIRASAAAAAFAAAQTNTELKLELLTLGASLDRGQSYNPTSSDAYKERMIIATDVIERLCAASPPLPTSLDALDGEWELVFTNVAHGIFRSSPFFLAIQEAYAREGAAEKATLFFKLHELQTCSWGVSKIGRVAQTIDASAGMLYSEFDTNLLSLTVIPLLGFWKVAGPHVPAYRLAPQRLHLRSHLPPPLAAVAADVWRLCDNRVNGGAQRRRDRDGGGLHNLTAGPRPLRATAAPRRGWLQDCRPHLEPARPRWGGVEAAALEQGHRPKVLCQAGLL
jgi:hypothetical protein